MTYLEAIQNRRSCRKFINRPIDPTVIDALTYAAKKLEGLEADNSYSCQIEQVRAGSELFEKVLGGMVRLYNPQYVMVPYIKGGKRFKTDFGFRTEQLILRLTILGLSSCWINADRLQDSIKQTVGLSDDCWIGGLVFIGYPSVTFRQSINGFLGSLFGGKKRDRFPLDMFVFSERFGAKVNLKNITPDVCKLLDSARCAPSPANKQPWRFIISKNEIYVIVFSDHTHYTNTKESREHEYHLIDGGIVLAHMYLTAIEMGIELEVVTEGSTGYTSSGAHPDLAIPEGYSVVGKLLLPS